MQCNSNKSKKYSCSAAWEYICSTWQPRVTRAHFKSTTRHPPLHRSRPARLPHTIRASRCPGKRVSVSRPRARPPAVPVAVHTVERLEPPHPPKPNRAFFSPGKGRGAPSREGKSYSPWAWLLRAHRYLFPSCCSSSSPRSSPPLPSFIGRPGRRTSTSGATSPPSPGVPLESLCPLI